VSEKRNYFADNLIGIIVDGYPEEGKNRRKELVASHQELLTQNVVTLPETNSANPSVNLFSLFMTEIKKMLEDIKEFLAETSQCCHLFIFNNGCISHFCAFFSTTI
jgi:hypothetical protein